MTRAFALIFALGALAICFAVIGCVREGEALTLTNLERTRP